MNRAHIAWAAAVLLVAGGARADYIQFQADTNTGSGVGATVSSDGTTATVSFSANQMTMANVRALNNSNHISPLTISGYGVSIDGTFSFTLSDIFNAGTQATLSSGTGNFSVSVTDGSVTTTLAATLKLNDIFTGSGGGDTIGGLNTLGNISLTFTPTSLTTSDNSANYDPLLARLDTIGGAQMVVDFIFPSDITSLTGLVQAGSGEAPYTGYPTLSTILVTSHDPIVPVPASWLMLATGTTLLGGFRLARRRGALALA